MNASLTIQIRPHIPSQLLHLDSTVMYLNTFQVQGNFEAHGSTADTVLTMTMTVDDLSSTYSPEESLAVIYQKSATGRRCHKTLKGGGEAVWPPNLEAALITGLQVYSDRHRVHMRHRGRFIGRNHFLAAYVKSLTGRPRSAKQVGSRLQQLKDTCRELEILYLITGKRSLSRRLNPRRRDPRRGGKPGSKACSQRSMSSSPELSDYSDEPTPEPEFESPSPSISTPEMQSVVYPAVTVAPTPTTYQTPTSCSYSSEQSVPAQYYTTTSQHYPQTYPQVQEWSAQQWVSYYNPQVETSQQYAYYDAECY